MAIQKNGAGNGSDSRDFKMLIGFGGEVVQPPEKWIDTSQALAWETLGQILGITNCTLYTETGDGAEGPWLVTAADDEVFYRVAVVSGLDPSEPRGRYIRWRVKGLAAATWKICFRVSAKPVDELKGAFQPAGVARATPTQISGPAVSRTVTVPVASGQARTQTLQTQTGIARVQESNNQPNSRQK